MSSTPTPAALKLQLHAFEVNDPIPPLGKRTFDVLPGEYFYVDDASHANFTLTLNDSVTIRGRKARGHLFPDGQKVRKVTVINLDTSRALTLRIETGQGRPIDEGLNVYTDDVTPTVRMEGSSSFTVVSAVCTGVGNSVALLPADCGRKSALLFVSTGGEAYYGPDNTTAWPTVDGNRVGQSLVNSATPFECCAACYVRGAVGTTVYAFVFGY